MEDEEGVGLGKATGGPEGLLRGESVERAPGDGIPTSSGMCCCVQIIGPPFDWRSSPVIRATSARNGVGDHTAL